MSDGPPDGPSRESAEGEKATDAEYDSVRKKALTGGTHLIVRQVTGLALRSFGVLLLTRYIGPANYGVYAGALAIATLVAAGCRFGMDVFLIRYVGKRVLEVEEQVFSFLLVSCLVGVAVAVGIAAIVATTTSIQGVSVLIVLVLLIPVNVLWVPAAARLQREFRYRSLARIELAGDAFLYGVSVPAAIAGAGVWAPVAGYAAWQTWLLIASYRSAGWHGRWRWEWPLLARITRYGATYSPSFWATRLRDIVNPIVVGHYVGAAGVGQVALALRLCANLAFVDRTVNQVIVPTLSRLQGDRSRLERAHSEAVLISVLGVGVPMLMVTWAMPIALPLLIGDEWQAVSSIFPLIAVFMIISGPFRIHERLLNVVGRNLVIFWAQGLSVVMLALIAAFLVPRLGPEGFGWATIGATLPLVILDRAVRPLLTPLYGSFLRWACALVPPMFVPLIQSSAGWLLTLPTLIVLALPSSRAEISGAFQRFWRARGSSRSSTTSTPPAEGPEAQE